MMRFLAFALIVGGLPTGSFAQPDPIVVPATGTEIFRDELAAVGLRPSDRNDWNRNPSRSIAIVVGDKSWIRSNLAWIRDFVFRGGTLMLATDDESPANDSVWDSLGLRISQHFVAAPKDSCWRRIEAFPWAIPKRKLLEDRPVVRKIFEGQSDQSVATNRPRAISERVDIDKWRGLEWTPLAGFPIGSSYDDEGGRFGKRKIDFPPPELLRPELDLLAWSGTYGAGRIVVFGDTGPFLNDVVKQTPEENRNFEMLGQLANWLAKDGGVDRTSALFVDNSTIRTTFALPRDDLPEVPFDVMANIVLNSLNGVIDELQRSGKINPPPGSRVGQEVKKWVLIRLGIILILIAIWRLVATRAGGDPARQFLSTLPRVQMWGRTGRSRITAMMEEGQLYEAARYRVRARMESLFPASLLESRPQIVIDDRVRDRGVLETRIQSIWNIGYGKLPLVVNPDGWRVFVEDLADAIESHEAREWTFEPRPV